MLKLGNITPIRAQKLVAVVFVACLMISFFSSFDVIKSKAMDIKRRADLKNVVKALDLYHDKYGRYPESTNEWQGWDLSIGYNGGQQNFLSVLKTEGFIDREAADPINNVFYHYRYQKYKAGDFGCPTAFYILQATNFELSTKDNGRGECPELNWVESAPNGYTAQDVD